MPDFKGEMHQIFSAPDPIGGLQHSRDPYQRHLGGGATSKGGEWSGEWGRGKEGKEGKRVKEFRSPKILAVWRGTPCVRYDVIDVAIWPPLGCIAKTVMGIICYRPNRGAVGGDIEMPKASRGVQWIIVFLPGPLGDLGSIKGSLSGFPDGVPAENRLWCFLSLKS